MIKGKIIELEQGEKYYILEELTYNNKKYALAIEDGSEEEVADDKYIVMEIKLENNDLVTAHIKNPEEAVIVSKMLLDKVRQED